MKYQEWLSDEERAEAKAYAEKMVGGMKKDLIKSYERKVRVISSMLLDCPESSVDRLTAKRNCYMTFIKELKQLENN